MQIIVSNSCCIWNEEEVIIFDKAKEAIILCMNKKRLIVDWYWLSLNNELRVHLWRNGNTSKLQMTNGCKMVSKYFVYMDYDLENHYAIVFGGMKKEYQQ